MLHAKVLDYFDDGCERQGAEGVPRWLRRCSPRLAQLSYQAVSRAKRARRARQARKAGRSLHREWAVDTAIPEHGDAHWALADPRGRIAAAGRVAVQRTPAPDSTHAEASGILNALEAVPEGAKLLTDALSVARAVASQTRRAEISGRAGEIADRAAARGVRLRWARRTNALLRAAHRAATANAKRAAEQQRE